MTLTYQLNHENKWLALGAGLAYPLNQAMDLKLDYAFSFSELLNDQHKISLSFLNQISDARQDGAQVREPGFSLEDIPTFFKIGLGVGRDFGRAGINLEVMASKVMGIYLGMGALELLSSQFNGAPPKLCLGTRYYLGESTSTFRGKFSFSLSNGVLTYREYYSIYYEMFPELSTTFGFQWRLFEVLSLDLGAGIAIGLVSGSFQSNLLLSPEINAGILFHFPKNTTK